MLEGFRRTGGVSAVFNFPSVEERHASGTSFCAQVMFSEGAQPAKEMLLPLPLFLRRMLYSYNFLPLAKMDILDINQPKEGYHVRMRSTRVKGDAQSTMY